MVETYNKLIRDKLIEHMEKKGLKVDYEILDDNRYIKELYKKLVEEVNEYIRDYSIEEMADIMEVIYAILDAKNISMEQVEKVRNEKREKRGAFKERIFLKTVEE